MSANQSNPAAHVGQRIRFYRKNKNLSQEQLASLIHKSKSTLSKYESGTISVDVESLCDIARALDVEIHQLIDIKTREVQPYTAVTPLFDGEEQLYMYYYDGRFKCVVKTFLEMKYSRAKDNQIPCYCYMDCPSFERHEQCKYFYMGVMTCFDLISYITLGNPNNPMEQLTFCILNPFHRGMDTWGFMLAISYNPIAPLTVKFLISPMQLPQDRVQADKLRLSKDEIKSIKDTNMLLLRTPWP